MSQSKPQEFALFYFPEESLVNITLWGKQSHSIKKIPNYSLQSINKTKIRFLSCLLEVPLVGLVQYSRIYALQNCDNLYVTQIFTLNIFKRNQ